MVDSRYFALVPAAGVGARLGIGFPKQYLPLAGKPMLLHVIETFAASPAIAHCFVVVSAEDAYIDEVIAASSVVDGRVTILRHGGATRHESVLNGLKQVRGQVGDEDWILVHDAARPGLSDALIGKLIAELRNDPVGGLLALPVVDTLKRGNADTNAYTRAVETVPRAGLWGAQTPQMFRYALLCRALEEAAEVTDEASAIEALGLAPKLVEGSVRNFKVTLPQDIALAELLLKGMS